MKKLLSIFLVLLTLNCAFGTVTIGISNLTTNTSFTVVASYWKIVNSDGSDTGGRESGPGTLPGPGGYSQIHNDDPYAGQGFSYHLEYEVSGTTAVQTYDSGYMAAGSYADCFLNGVTPPVYTNYTYCITNYSLNLLANVTFHFQSSALQVPGNPAFGTVGYNEYATLVPGGSTCFTTPQIEVSPTADVWSASLNSQTIPAPFNPGTNSDGSPNVTFGNNPQGGGTSGTFGGTGGTPSAPTGNGTPTAGGGGTITNAPVFAPGTNSDVLFQAPQGLASESTLNSGFQLLHSDNVNLLTGEKIINDTLTAGNLMTMYMTNALGQIVANTYRMGSNSDQIPTLLRSVTNLLGNLPTNNQVSLNLTNTGSTLTNYATEITLQGISNLLSQMYSNSIPTNTIPTNSVDSLMSQGADAASSGSNTLASLAGAEPNLNSDNSYGSPPGEWTISFGSRFGTFDLNPFHQTWVVNLAAFIRFLVKWIMIVTLMGSNINSLLPAVAAAGANRQATASGESILGTNLNLVTALAMAVAITAVSIALVVFAVTHLASYVTQIHTDPFSSSAASGASVAIWMANQFFPLSCMVACPVAYYTFRVTLSAVVWSVQKITLFLTG